MFVGRRDDGTIYGTWTVQQWPGQEELPDLDPSVEAFTASTRPADVRGFEGALKAYFSNNLQALNGLLAKYPLFLWSLRDTNWTYVEQMLIGAHMAGDFTDRDYAAIKAAAADKHIPVTLP